FEQARARAKGFKVGLIRVEKYFEGTHITAYADRPPMDGALGAQKRGGGHAEPDADYCWGGCPGALEEAIEILRLYDKECDAKLPRMHIVFGAYDGPIDAKPGEKVVFIGDCAKYHGKINDKPVQIRSKYVDRSKKDPHHAKHDDIFAKMFKVRKQVKEAQ